jgi:hypothetical protein
VRKDQEKHIKRIEENKQAYKDFKATAKYDKLIYFDTTRLEFYAPDTLLSNTKTPIVYKYSQVMDCDILITEGTVTRTVSTTSTKRGMGKAIIGGALFGGVGAIVGAAGSKSKSNGTATSRDLPVANELKIKIETNDISHPIVTVVLLDKELRKSTRKFEKINETANEIFKIFKAIADNNRETFDSDGDDADDTGTADEIRKYKSLMDDGIITAEEFAEKKKQLLGL